MYGSLLQATLDSASLEGCILYSSCEPCPMCFGASVFARVDKVYYGLDRHDAHRFGFLDGICYEMLLDDEKRKKYCVHAEVDGAVKAMEMFRDSKK